MIYNPEDQERRHLYPEEGDTFTSERLEVVKGEDIVGGSKYFPIGGKTKYEMIPGGEFDLTIRRSTPKNKRAWDEHEAEFKAKADPLIAEHVKKARDGKPFDLTDKGDRTARLIFLEAEMKKTSSPIYLGDVLKTRLAVCVCETDLDAFEDFSIEVVQRLISDFLFLLT